MAAGLAVLQADVRGLDRIPTDGPVLLVGNHSGGNLPPDTFVFTLAFCSYFGVERPFYQLAHNLVVSMPGLGSLRKFGTVAANHDNATLALESGGALLVYPGGDYEVFRPSWKRHEVDFGGRKGYVKLARDAGVPIVPIASVGGQEAALFLDRGQWLAKLLMVDKMARLKSVPIPWRRRGAWPSATWCRDCRCRRRSRSRCRIRSTPPTSPPATTTSSIQGAHQPSGRGGPAGCRTTLPGDRLMSRWRRDEPSGEEPTRKKRRT